MYTRHDMTQVPVQSRTCVQAVFDFQVLLTRLLVTVIGVFCHFVIINTFAYVFLIILEFIVY